MKKFGQVITILLISVLLSFSLFGCDKNSGSSKEDAETIIIRETKEYISARIYLTYSKTPSLTCRLTKKSSTSTREEYLASGNISVYSDGKTYKGTYTATVYYYLDTQSVSIASSDISKLYA